MRKFLFFLMVLPLMFISCSGSDDGDGNFSGSLVGKWEAVSEYVFEDGEWVFKFDYDAGEYLWEITSNGKVKIYEDAELMETYTYAYNASTKEISVAGVVWKVAKLTASEFELIQWEEDKTVFKRVN